MSWQNAKSLTKEKATNRPNEKKKYGHVTEDEAGQIISAASTGLKIAEMLSDKSNGQTTYKAQDMVLDSRLWPTLAKVLKIEGQPGEAELDFKKVAKWFNGKIQGICKASQPPVKELSAGEFRKAALAATRQRLVVAKKELKRRPRAHRCKLRLSWTKPRPFLRGKVGLPNQLSARLR